MWQLHFQLMIQELLFVVNLTQQDLKPVSYINTYVVRLVGSRNPKALSCGTHEQSKDATKDFIAWFDV